MPVLLALDIAAVVFSAAVALSMLLIAASSEIKRLRNLSFVVFAAVFATWTILMLLLLLSLWFGAGNPLVLTEFVGLTFGLIPPTLFIFASHHTERWTRVHAAAGALGVLATAAFAVPLFGGRIVSDPRIVANGSVVVSVSGAVWVYGIVPVTLFAWTLRLFRQSRRRLGDSYSSWAVLLLAVGMIVDGFLQAAFPALSIAAAVGIGTLGYAVLRKQLFNPLRESEAKFRSLAEQSPNMIFINRHDRIVYANTVWGEVMGYGRSELCRGDFDFLRLVAPDSLDTVKERLAVHATGNEAPPFECGLMRRDGVRIDAILATKLIEYDGEKAVLGVITDITDRKRFERLLLALNRAALAMEQTIVSEELCPAVGAVLEELGFLCICYKSNEGERQLSLYYSTIEDDRIPETIDPTKAPILSELLGNHRPKLLPTELVFAPVSSSAEGLGYGASKSFAAPLVSEDEVIGLLVLGGNDLRESDAPVLTALANQIAAAWRKAALMVGLRESLNELERTQDRLLQARKIEAVGTMAGGLAHDLNNILGAIRGYTSVLSQDFGHHHGVRDAVEEIGRATSRASGLIEQLLAFGRRQALREDEVNPDSVITEMQGIIEQVLGERTHLALALDAGGARIRTDRQQLERVLLNLVVNARDAMPDGGTLTIATSRCEIGVNDVSTSIATPVSTTVSVKMGEVTSGAYVSLSVSDTGIGMDAHVMDRLFEPFFTTKETGKGAGLGLSTVYGFVTQSGGQVSVESRPGEGTVFVILMPIV